MNSDDAHRYAEQLVGQLERWHATQDRGPLAKLRRGLSETTRHEAWFVLGRLCGPEAVSNPVFATVAGCFALHPCEKKAAIGNFGATMREAMPADKMQSDDEPHARFRRLLACRTRDELCRHLPHAVRLAKSREVIVNYRRLFVDLWFWGENVKIDWAKTYWQAPDQPPEFSLAGAGSLESDGEDEILPES